MSGAAAVGISLAEDSWEIPWVIARVVLTGAALRLGRMLDRALLEEAGWDPRVRVLFLPAQHRLLGRPVCRADACGRSVHAGLPGVCHRCFTRLTARGLSPAEIAAAAELPAAPVAAERCAVTGCERRPTARQAVLCPPHAKHFRDRQPQVAMGQFLGDPRVRPLAACAPCLVAACTRAADGACGCCSTHYQRWRTAGRGEPGLDHRRWRATEPGVAEPGQVNLRALPPLVVVEVLFGLQQRIRAGARLTDANLRPLCDTVRRQQPASITECDAGRFPSKASRSLLRAFVRDVRRALADPGAEQANDTWDLAIFGHRGNLSFTGIAQPWLARSAKRWAAEQLPRHRGGGAARVQSKISALGMLSEYLGCRADHGLLPAALGRPDIEGFANRLAYLESTGTISRYWRNLVSRDVRAALAGIRALGLTRAGGPAAGLAGDFAIERRDIPADPARGEPCRDLPAEIMAGLCASLEGLEPAEVRVATQIAIDTGRRPEDILALPLGCLARDKDGGPVLVYDNAKADRLGRRLPIGEATATVIIGQQDRARARFPDTPAAELKLLPTPRRNPDGRRPISISMLERRHREWADALPTLRTADGVEFDRSRIVPYAYRHTYAQRHADGGVPIDVLAELLDHRSYTVTRGYYRIGEDRRRAAVDQVSALSFDRHGNRVWREARALLESEHARYAVGGVAVPYGLCTEPSNVKAGGNACPFRFRCAGCDHFRTDLSYLPDLAAYLDDLLRNRERVLAATDVDGMGTGRGHALRRGDHRRPSPHRPDPRRPRRPDPRGPSPHRRRRRHRPPSPQRHGRHAPRSPAPARPRPGGHRVTTAGRPPSTMGEGRRADSARRRQRVLKALNDAGHDGEGRSVSGIARRAGVDRSFLYRHRDLLEQIHAVEAQQPDAAGVGPGITRASLQADLLNAQQRAARLAARVHQLEGRLSDALGEQAWRESGLGAPDDIDQLRQRMVVLEQQVVDLRLQLDERGQDLDAARAANREFMTQLNAQRPAT